MELSRLEKAVLTKLLDGDHPVLAALRRQLSGASVKSRQWTGTGFYTELATSEAAPVVPSPSAKLRFGDVEATIAGLVHGAGFVLYVDGGLLHMLEGYSYEEAWLESAGEFSLRYRAPDPREVLATFG